MFWNFFSLGFDGVVGGRGGAAAGVPGNRRRQGPRWSFLSWCFLAALFGGVPRPAAAQIERAWSRPVTQDGRTVALVPDADGALDVVANEVGKVVTARFDGDGNQAWSATYDTSMYDEAFGGVADGQGEVWVVGRSSPPNGIVGSTVFTLKYDAQGRVMWERALPGNEMWSGRIALADAGNVCVAGTAGSSGAVVVGYDRDGNLRWSHRYSAAMGGFLDRESVRATQSGEAYVSWLEHTGNAPARSVLRKFGRDGTPLWSASDSESQLGGGPEIAVDVAGDVYLSVATDLQAFALTKYRASGERLWTRTRTRPFPTYHQAVVVDAGGHPVVAGTDFEYRKLCTDCGESETIYRLTLARYASGGEERWSADGRLGRELSNYAYGELQTDPDGGVYVGGNYWSRSDDTGTRTEFVVRKFGPEGGQVWSTNFPGTLSGNLVVDAAGSLYFAVGNGSTNELRKYVQPRRGPYFVTDLASQTALRGHPVLLYVEAGGFPSPRFRWHFDGVEIVGATNNALEFSSVETRNGGRYSVVISNSLGAVTSAVATLVVEGRAPEVSVKVVTGSLSVRSGDLVQFCATVTGGPVPRVQWQRNGADLPGETNLCFSLPYVQPEQAGTYRVVATNELGSAGVDLSLAVAPAVVQVSAPGLPLVIGQCVQLCALNGLTPPVTYQWLRNGQPLPERREPCLNLCAATTNDGGIYGVTLSNASGSYSVGSVDVPVLDAPPQAASVALVRGYLDSFVGESMTLRAVYQGSPATIQWVFDGLALAGATNRTLDLIDLQTTQAGGYAFVARNALGAVTSAVAQVRVAYGAPLIPFVTGNRTVVEGSRVEFPAFARGGPPPGYRLQFEGRPLDAEFSYDCCDGGSGGFVLDDVTVADSGAYAFVAFNTLGAVTSVVSTLTVVPAGPWDRWEQRNPLPQARALLALTHGPTGFVAVGDEGATVTSPDGIRWSDQGRRGQKALRGVTFGGGQYIAVGNSGVIYASVDGTHWVRRHSAYQTHLNDVVYADGRFLAVGGTSGGTALVIESGDGTNWVRRSLAGVPELTSVTYGGGTFVAVGLERIVSSGDGTNWVSRLELPPLTEMTKVVFGGQRFLAVGDGAIWVSADGQSWEDRSVGALPKLLGAAYGGGRYVVVGVRGNLLSSTDTVIWRTEDSGTPDRMETVDYAGGLFVAAGENGTLITSPDGVAWTKRNQGTTRDLDGLGVSGDGLLVVVGKGGTLLTSGDGVHYDERDAGTTSDLHGVAWSAEGWVAVGEEGAIVTSADGVRWTRQASGVTTSLKDVIRAEGQWVVVGTRSTLLTSGDGVVWTRRGLDRSGGLVLDLNGVAFGNGTYLVVGDGATGVNGSLFRSTDGVQWNLLPFSFGKNLRGITFDQGVFMIAGNDGTVGTTADGAGYVGGWGRGGGNLRDIAWTHDRWTVVGNNGYLATVEGGAGTVVSRPSGTPVHLHRVVPHRGKVIVIGNHGAILQSAAVAGALEAPVRRPDGGVVVGIQGVRDRVYRLRATTNWGDWTSLTVFTNRSERVEYLDETAAEVPFRFYQLQAE